MIMCHHKSQIIKHEYKKNAQDKMKNFIWQSKNI